MLVKGGAFKGLLWGKKKVGKNCYLWTKPKARAVILMFTEQKWDVNKFEPI